MAGFPTANNNVRFPNDLPPAPPLSLLAARVRWFVKFWTLDNVKEWRCLKATQLQDFVVDLYPQMEGDDPAEENHVLTDKKFLYEVRERQNHRTRQSVQVPP